MKTVLAVSAHADVVQAIHNCFRSKYKVERASHLNSAIEVLKKRRIETLYIDVEIVGDGRGGATYKSAFIPFWNIHPTLNIIVISSQENIREAVKAVKDGASDYLTYPINPEELIYITDNVYESRIIQSELHYLRDQFWERESLDIVQTKSEAMQNVFKKIKSVAPTKSTVLLIGETGTGKGVLARLLHQHSNRRKAQFISVHCGAIPDTLIESELFGHEKGSFTGADRRKLGKFEIAGGGTIFLDEIGTISPLTQIKLLQVLQDGTFQRVGGETTIDSDVRVITATNANLREMCENGQFRKDLYYRLNVFPIEIPPLRERPEDIPFLVNVLLKKINRRNTKEIADIHPQVLDAFVKYPWPGNIREVENLIERAFILEESSVLRPGNFPAEIFEGGIDISSLPIQASMTLADVRNRGVAQIEKKYLKELLTQNKGKINNSAATANITTRQFHKLMTKYGIRKEAFK